MAGPQAVAGATAGPQVTAGTAAEFSTVKDDSGVGAFFLGLWQIIMILNAYGWATQPGQMQEYSSVAAGDVPSHLRYLLVALVVNAVWAALLVRRHWPAPGRSFTTVKDRFWFYVGYALLSAVGAVAVLVSSIDVIA